MDMKRDDANPDWQTLVDISKNLLPPTHRMLNRNTLTSLTNEANRINAQTGPTASSSQTLNWFRQRGINLQQPQLPRRVDTSRIHEIPSGIPRQAGMEDPSLIQQTSSMTISQRRKRGMVPTDNQLVEQYIPPYQSAVSGRFLDLRPFLRHRHEHAASATIQEAQLRHARYFREKYCEHYESEWDKSRAEILKSISSGGGGGYGLVGGAHNTTSVAGSVMGDMSFANDTSVFGGGLSSIHGYDPNMTGFGSGPSSTLLAFDPRSSMLLDGATMLDHDVTMGDMTGMADPSTARGSVSQEYCHVMKQFAEFRKHSELTVPASSNTLTSVLTGDERQDSSSSAMFFAPFDAYRRTHESIFQRMTAQNLPTENLSTLFEIWSIAGTMMHESLYESTPPMNTMESENVPPQSGGMMGGFWNFISGGGGSGQQFGRIIPPTCTSPRIEPRMNVFARAFHEYGNGRGSERCPAKVALQRLFAYGARRYLERMYLDHMANYIDGNQEISRLGGDLSTRAYVLAFLRCTFPDRLPGELKHTVRIGNEVFPLWACIYLSFRVGDARTAIDFARSSHVVSHSVVVALTAVQNVYERFSRLPPRSSQSQSTVDYVDPHAMIEFWQQNDFVLESDVYDALKREYDSEVAERNDPYEMTMYALLGLCDAKVNEVEILMSGNRVSNYTVQHVEDYLWLKLCTLDLHDEGALPFWVDRNENSNMPFRVSTLEEVQNCIHEMGAEHFDGSGGQNPFVFAKILMLTQQFERAVEFLYLQDRLVEAVHLGVALRFYGCLGSGLDLHSTRTHRTEIHQHVSELIVQLIERESMISEAFYYTYMIDGNNDITHSKSKCVETLVRYVSEPNMNIFSTYLGRIERESTVVMSGLIPQYFSVEQTRQIGCRAGEAAKRNGNDEHAIQLYLFSGDFESAGCVAIRLLSHVVMQKPNSNEKKRAEDIAVRVFRVNQDASKYQWEQAVRMSDESKVNLMRGIGLCEFFDAYLEGASGYAQALSYVAKYGFVPLNIGRGGSGVIGGRGMSGNLSGISADASGSGGDAMMVDADGGGPNLSAINSGISSLLHEQNTIVMDYKNNILSNYDDCLSKYIPDVCVAVMAILAFQIDLLKKELAFDTRAARSILLEAGGYGVIDSESQEKQRLLGDKSAQCELIERFYSEISTTIYSTQKCSQRISQLFNQTRLS